MKWRVGVTFGALCVIWGLPYFFIKLALTELPPVSVAWGRIALGAAVLLPVAWKRGSLRGLGGHKGVGVAFDTPLTELSESCVAQSFPALLCADDRGREGP